MNRSTHLYSGVGRGGFTLVELLVAMAVTGVIMASVATLAYAMGSVNDSADDTSRTQARLRYASLRIGELLKHCKLVCPAAGGDLALWRADENDDNSINPNELVYIELGENGDCLGLLEFTTVDSLKISLADIRGSSIKNSLTANYGPEGTVLIPNCSNARFYPAGITAESRGTGQTIRYSGLSEHFQKIFDMVGLARYIEIFPTTEDALKDF